MSVGNAPAINIRRPSTGSGRSIVIATWTLILLIGVSLPLLRGGQTDQAWALYLAERMLDGGHYGPDFVEINPPLFVWLSVPPVLLERLTGVSSWTLWIAIVILPLVVTVLALLSAFTKTLEADEGRCHALLLAAGFALLVLPRLDFSEREHLAVILTLPFVSLVAVRAAGTAAASVPALLSGIMGGLGFSLKPHFLVVWLVLELWLWHHLRARTLRRPELATLVLVGAGYIVAVVWFVPDYVTMSFRLASYYNAYLRNSLIYTLGMGGLPVLLLPAIAVSVYSKGNDDSLLKAFTLTSVGFLTSAILQRKGFSYHYVPALVTGLLMLTRAWQCRPPGLNWRPSGIVMRIGWLLLLFLPLRAVFDAGREVVRPDSVRYLPDASYMVLLREVRRLASDGPILVMSSNPGGGWPLVMQAGTGWSSRYNCLWPIVAVYDREIWTRPYRLLVPRPFGERHGFERQFHDEVLEDLELNRPTLIAELLPDTTVPGLGGSRRINYMGYFMSDPRFQAFMSDYRAHSTVGHYRLWLRVSGGTGLYHSKVRVVPVTR